MDADNSNASSKNVSARGQPTDAKNGFGPNFDWAAFQQTDELQDQVVRLTKELEQKIDENEKLSDAVLTLTKELELNESQGNTEVAKNLAKKNKEWRLLVQKKEAEVYRLKTELQELRDGGEVGRAQPAPREKTQDEKDEQITELKSSVKEWKERYKTVSMNKIDFRKKIHDANAQAQKARKLLIEEVGDEKVVQELLDSRSRSKKDTAKWRGRAQQISILQSKVRELKKKLGGGPKKGAPLSFQERQEQNVTKAAERKKFQEQLAREQEATAEAQSKIATLKRKYDASRARSKILEKNVHKMKEQIKVLLAKSDSDDKYIDRLKKNLAKNTQRMESTLATSVMKPKEALDIRGQLKEKDRVIARQAQQMAKLQTKLGSARASTAEDFKTAVQSWDFADKERQIVTLTAQNKKQAEILQHYAQTLQDAKIKIASVTEGRDEMDRKFEVLKKRLENRKTIKPVTKDQIQKLNEKIATMSDDLSRMKAARERDVAHYEREVQLARELLEEQKQAIQADREAMKKKFMQAMKNIQG